MPALVHELLLAFPLLLTLHAFVVLLLATDESHQVARPLPAFDNIL